MYTIMLATVLTTGNAAPAQNIYIDLRNLQRSVEVLREEQNDARIQELKLVIAGLRERITDEKLDEIRRDVRQLQRVEVPYRGVALPMPTTLAPVIAAPTRATISVEVPSGANFIVNNKEVAVPAVNPTFVTPPLVPDKDYFYDCKVKVIEDGKTVTRIKRVKVRAGALVRISYEDMDAAP